MCFGGLYNGIDFVAIISFPSDYIRVFMDGGNVRTGRWWGERGRGRKKRRRTIRRSNNLFELSLHPATKYFPSLSNSTDVISPKQSASV
jgi:hypothetical protein